MRRLDSRDNRADGVHGCWAPQDVPARLGVARRTDVGRRKDSSHPRAGQGTRAAEGPVQLPEAANPLCEHKGEHAAQSG